MKAAFILAAAAGVMGQNLSGIPQCALECINAVLPNFCSSVTDVACQCEPATNTKIAAAAAPCVLNSCTNPADISQAGSAGAALCAAFSATASSGSGSSTGAPTTTPPPTGSDTAATTSATTSPPVSTGGSNNNVTTPHPTQSSSSTTSSSIAGAATPVVMAGGALLGLIGAIAAL